MSTYLRVPSSASAEFGTGGNYSPSCCQYASAAGLDEIQGDKRAASTRASGSLTISTPNGENAGREVRESPRQ